STHEECTSGLSSRFRVFVAKVGATMTDAEVRVLGSRMPFSDAFLPLYARVRPGDQRLRITPSIHGQLHRVDARRRRRLASDLKHARRMYLRAFFAVSCLRGKSGSNDDGC